MSEREQRFPKIVLSPREESSRLPLRKLPNGDAAGLLMPSRYGLEFDPFGSAFESGSMPQLVQPMMEFESNVDPGRLMTLEVMSHE